MVACAGYYYYIYGPGSSDGGIGGNTEQSSIFDFLRSQSGGQTPCAVAKAGDDGDIVLKDTRLLPQSDLKYEHGSESKITYTDPWANAPKDLSQEEYDKYFRSSSPSGSSSSSTETITPGHFTEE